jgi:hypothetical protein
VQVLADLRFTVDVPPRVGGGRPRSTRCSGQVHSEGTEVTVDLTPMPSLGGASTRPLVRPLAEQLDRLGLTVQIVGPHGPLVRLGAGVRAPWWQRLATHSARIQLLSVRALAASVGGPDVFAVALSPAAALPALGRDQRTRRRRSVLAARQLFRRVTGRRRSSPGAAG